MARLDARWFNFTKRGQKWWHFWQDASAPSGGGSSYTPIGSPLYLNRGTYPGSGSFSSINLGAGESVIIGCLTNWSQNVVSIDDGGSNSLTEIARGTLNNSRTLSFWLIENTTANSSCVFALNYSGGSALSFAYLQRFTGIVPSSFNAWAEGNVTGSATVTTNLRSLTTTAANTVLFSLVCDEDPGDAGQNPPTGFTHIISDAGIPTQEPIGSLDYKLETSTLSGVTITATGASSAYSKRILVVALEINPPSSGGLLTINLSDSITLSDSIIKEFQTTKTDTITATDAIIKELQTTASDSVTLSDTIVKETQLNPADSVTLSDAIGSKELQTNIVDSVTLSDSISKNFETTIADSVTLTDAIVKETQLTQADTVTLSDSITEKQIQLNKADTITLSDAIVKEMQLSLSDLITLSDSIVKQLEKSIADTVVLTDSYTIDRVISIILSDSISLSDSILTKQLDLNIADTIALSDTIAKTIEKTLADSVTLTDAQVKVYETILNDALALSDNLIKQTEFSLSDSVTLTDALTNQIIGGYGGTLYQCVNGVLELADLPNFYNNRTITGKRLWYIKDGVKKLIHTASH